MQSNVSKEVMIGYGLLNGTLKAIWLHSVELCLSRARETGKNMGENSCKEFEDGEPVFLRTG
jgi:hypothetical protein